MAARSRTDIAAVGVGVSGALAFVVIVAIGPLTTPAARSISLLLIGVVGVGSGALLWRRLRGRTGLRWASRLLGLGIAVWGLGECVIGLTQTGVGLTYPGPGDVISLAAMPVGVLGLLMALAEQDLPGARLALVLDAFLAGSSASVAVWQLVYVPVAALHGDAWSVLLLLAETLVVAVVLMAWLRDLRLSLLGTVAGVLAFVVADQLGSISILQGRAIPWTGLAISAVSWPLSAVSLSHYQPMPSDVARDPSADSRSSMSATIVAAGSLAVMIAVAAVRGPLILDLPFCTLITIVLLAFAARELVSARRRTRLIRELVALATTDPLTGTGNRRGLTADLAKAAVGASVWTIDLDRFKEVNDVLGHARGDEVLKAVAGALVAALTAGDLYRIGGDEFVAIVPPHEPQDVVGERLLVGLRRVTGDLSDASGVLVTGSVGVTVIDAEDRDVGRLQVLARSNFAMHEAKTAGRDRLAGYDAGLAAGHRRAVQLEARLRRAIELSEIDVAYQPIVALDGSHPPHVEALARWTDHELGAVSPVEFVPVAERSGLVVAMGFGVLRRALADVRSGAVSMPGAVVTVNVSPVQLRFADFAREVKAMLADAAVSPQQLVIEVTETVSADEDDTILAVLRELRSHGVGIALDDFGSGYSSMSYLARLPATIVKIDRSLTARMLTDDRSRTVVRSIIELSHGLGLTVCVEGIETPEQHAVVVALGAQLGQGWLYSAAVPWPDLADVVTRLSASGPLGRPPVPLRTGSPD